MAWPEESSGGGAIVEPVVLWSAPEFGAVGDGIADDSTALELILASSKNVDLTGGKFRITRSIAPNNLANINGKSGRKFAAPSGTTWTTETRLKTFLDYNGVSRTISATCAKVLVEGTWKAEIILDNSNYQFDKATLNIAVVASAGGSLPANNHKYYIVPIVDGVDFQCMYQSIFVVNTAGQQNTLTWTAFQPTAGAVTGYKIYGRNGYIGTTASLTFVDDGTVTPTGTLPDTNSSGIFMAGKYYGYEFTGIKVSIKWPTNPTLSLNTRSGVNFYPDFAYWFRMGIGPWDADTNGFIVDDCKFDFGDSLTGGTMAFITTNNRHAGISKAIRNVTARKCIFNTNNGMAFLDRSNVLDVGYTEKTITDILVEDCIFQGQGQIGHTKPFVTPEFRMGISEDGASRTKGFTVQRCRFDDYVYSAFEMVTNIAAGNEDLDVGFKANNNIVTNTGWTALGIGCGLTFNNSATYAVDLPRFYNCDINHNYFGDSALGEQFKFMRDSIIDSNIFDRSSGASAQRILEAKNWSGMKFTRNYTSDAFNTGNTVDGSCTFSLFDNNKIEFNRFDVTSSLGLIGITENNSIQYNVMNFNFTPATSYAGFMLQGAYYPLAKNNKFKNRIYFKAGTNANNIWPIYDATANLTLPKCLDDASQMYINNVLQTVSPIADVAYVAALTDLSARKWHLAKTFTLSGAPAGAWELRLPGVVGNRTITNNSGQACTLSCYTNQTKYVLAAGVTKTVNVSSEFAVTEVV